MFVNTDMVFANLSEIFSKGKIGPDEPVFRAFNSFLKDLGLEVVLTTFHLKPWNEKDVKHSGNGNSLGIYLGSTENFKANGFTQEANWGGSYSNTDLIKTKWKELAKEFGYPGSYYNQVAYTWFYDFEKCYLTDLVQRSKDTLISKIKRIIGWRAKPAYIFTSSTPAFNIIYNDENSFSLALKKGYFEKIKTMAVNILRRNDQFQLFRGDTVEINFIHREMENVNMYGLSRED